MNRLESASDSDERDNAYADAALAAASKEDKRAREFADKIEEAGFKKRTHAYLDVTLIGKALDKRDAPEALRLARLGDLTHLQRVWAYTEAARLLAKDDAAGAAESLDEALREARRISDGEPDRAYALMAVAAEFAGVDQSRAWDVLSEVVKAANAVAAFTGEDGGIQAQFNSKSRIAVSNFGTPGFNLARLFERLAGNDLYRAVDAAKNFMGETPRAVATIAAARSVLTEKRKIPLR